MQTKRRERTLQPGWWTLILLLALGLLVFTSMALFSGSFSRTVAVTLTSDRSGLVMEPGSKVKLRGVPVGRVATVGGGAGPVKLTLDIFPDQVKYIPANIQARIRATTAFGAKYVDLVYPSDPSGARIAAGAVIPSQNVSTEVNTVFQNLTNVLQKVDPAKLNSILSALSQGLRGQGPVLGEAITASNQVLQAINPRSETLRNDFRSLKGFSDTYGVAAQDILGVLDSLSTTSSTINANAPGLDALLTSVTGLSRSGTDLLARSKDDLITGIKALEPTTRLLEKYSPVLTCMLLGGRTYLDQGGYDGSGGNGKSVILDVSILLGDDPYKYPNNLPKVGAKGGPGGTPSCGSLPDVGKNWPVRQLITDTGWGTGDDWRANPGIGFPGYANYFPVTRANPESPSIRYPDGNAPGPIPYLGAPPYGAPMYSPDGTPLYPGLPPAPPPGAPREPGPPAPGSEPFTVPVPASVQPTPVPPLPVPAVPSP